LLVSKGADVNIRLPDGNTPLSWAKAKKNPAMIDLLKRAGAKES
jgi:ankyrin repeat protein